jgi:hypothetical protein
MNIPELLKQPRDMLAGYAEPFLDSFVTELASLATLR